jgi:hypothetical protein
MATQIKPTKKNSPAIHRGANRDNLPAESYMKNGASQADIDRDSSYETGAQWLARSNPSIGVTSKRNGNPTKTDGITMRGHGAAVKGIKSRGPMA